MGSCECGLIVWVGLIGNSCGPFEQDNMTDYSCSCLGGYSGASCEVDVDDCAGDP